jgi:hypothetical protein
MNIEKNQRIAGRSAKEVRDLLRILKSRGGLFQRYSVLTMSECADLVGEPLETCALLIKDLTNEGYLVVAESFRREAGVSLTPAGMRLATARVGTRFDRAAGDAIIDQLIAQAKKVDTSDLCYTVTRLTVCGSYAAGASSLGDIDVIVDVMPTIADREAWWNLASDRARAAGYRGMYVSEFWLDRIDTMLRNKKQRIHIVRGATQTDVRVEVYPRDMRLAAESTMDSAVPASCSAL